jgi:hypothetical protein
LKQLAVETTLDSSEPEAWSEVLEGVLQGNVEAIVSLRDMKVHIAQPSQSASYIMGSNVNVEGVLMETHRMLGSDYKAVRTMQDVGKWLQACWMVGSPHRNPTPVERTLTKQCREFQFDMKEGQHLEFTTLPLGDISMIETSDCSSLLSFKPCVLDDKKQSCQHVTTFGWHRLWVWFELLGGQVGIGDAVDFQVHAVDRTPLLQH